MKVMYAILATICGGTTAVALLYNTWWCLFVSDKNVGGLLVWWFAFTLIVTIGGAILTLFFTDKVGE